MEGREGREGKKRLLACRMQNEKKLQEKEVTLLCGIQEKRAVRLVTGWFDFFGLDLFLILSLLFCLNQQNGQWFGFISIPAGSSLVWSPAGQVGR